MALLPLRSLAVSTLLLSTGCFHLFAGGTSKEFQPPRRLEPAAIALPEGYRIEPVATGLTYPTDVTFDGEGTPYVIEAGYSYGEDFTEPRLLRIQRQGPPTVIARGSHAPWNGVIFHQGAFFVAAGGEKEGGRILRITPDGKLTALVTGLPSLGDHHTNGPAVGPDGALYFSVGTATNSGVVGPDNHDMGWLGRSPKFHDIPCRDVTLRGVNFISPNPLTPEPEDQALTGAFVPFGTPTQPGQRIRGQVPCSGAIFRLAPGGTSPELVAWGFRNPYGLGFSPEGRLYATENGHDVRGNRPIFGPADYFWAVQPGTWYGFPDFIGGKPVTQEWFKPPEKEQPQFLLAEHPGQPPAPVALLAVHSSSNHFAFSRGGDFGYAGQAFIAQFGDLSPEVGRVMAPVGYKVVRVDVGTGLVRDFAANKAKGSGGPASRLETGGLERPISARFDPSGNALYIVDFGVVTVGEQGYRPFKETGVLWRITRTPQEAP